MTISNIQQLHDLAETSLASYATIAPRSNEVDLRAALIDINTGADFVTPQASRFTDQYRLTA